MSDSSQSTTELPTTVSGWVDYTQTLHRRSIDMGLERVRVVVDRLGLAHPGKIVVAIAGTNGKGSSVSLMERIAHAHGLSVGAYTSPHLVAFNERIRLNLTPVDDAMLLEAFGVVEQARGEITLTYFEFATLTAAWIFHRQGLDVVCLEVGLGGRLDAVRAFDADISLITNVGLDHQNWLGVTREEIGYEKAGIMRPDLSAVCADNNPPQSLLNTASEERVDLWCVGRDFGIDTDKNYWEENNGPRRIIYKGLPTPGIPGQHQWANLAGVLAVIQRLSDRWPIDKTSLAEGIGEARLAGRLQFMPGDPPVLLDVSHNVDAVKVLADNIKHRLEAGELPHGRCLAVFGMLEDKAVDDIVAVIAPHIDWWFTADLNVERGLTAAQLAKRLEDGAITTQVTTSDHPVTSYLQALDSAESDDWILVFGSFHTVGDVIHHTNHEYLRMDSQR